MTNKVKVLATDFDGHSWDGWPFSDKPKWLVDAITKNEIVPNHSGETDYTNWDVTVENDTITAQPGDVIINSGYSLAVIFGPDHEEV